MRTAFYVSLFLVSLALLVVLFNYFTDDKSVYNGIEMIHTGVQQYGNN